MRFLHAVHFDHEKCMQQQSENLDFLDSLPTFVIDEEALHMLNNKGCIYCLGRDRNFRVITVISVKKMDFANVPIELLKRVLVLFTEQQLRTLLIPGQVENWCIILDLKDMGFFSIPAMVGFAHRRK